MLISPVQEYSVVLVIPDYYDRLYVEGLVRILMVDMGFKQFCVQQVLTHSAILRVLADSTFTGIIGSHIRRRHLECVRSRHGRSQD